MEVERIILAPYSAADMYALVEDIESYPQFLPWCERVEVTRDGDETRARLFIAYRGIRTSFMTVNKNRPAESVTVELVDGPLSALSGGWTFTPLEPRRSRVRLHLEYGFRSRVLETLFSPLFSVVFDRFADRFIERAKTHYGQQEESLITIELADAAQPRHPPRTLTLPRQTTAAAALSHIGIPAADATLSRYGRPCPPETVLADGDRLEINAPLPNDPRQQRRNRAQSR